MRNGKQNKLRTLINLCSPLYLTSLGITTQLEHCKSYIDCVTIRIYRKLICDSIPSREMSLTIDCFSFTCYRIYGDWVGFVLKCRQRFHFWAILSMLNAMRSVLLKLLRIQILWVLSLNRNFCRDKYYYRINCILCCCERCIKTVLDDRAVRDSERKAALMHFSTDQATELTQRQPQPVQPAPEPNPRVEHVKSLAKAPASE